MGLLVALCGLLLISSAYGKGEFSVIHATESLAFKGYEAVRATTLKEVYSAALGFSTEHYSNWEGFYILNPFRLPQAVVTIAVEGVNDIGQQHGHHFPLITNEDEGETFHSLSERILERYPSQENGKPQLHRIVTANGLEDLKNTVLRSIKAEHPKDVAHKYLKLDVEEDREFLKEINLLNQIAEKVETEHVVKSDYIPDVWWFQVSAIHALSDLHGANSTQAKEAKQLLLDTINRLNEAFQKAYGKDVLVTVITSDVAHTRVTRNILQTDAEAETSDKTKYNLASYYSKDYPAIFNLILWFGVVMLFSLIAICMTIANMDPGRDSIIYRMTSTRMKKDN